MNAFNQITISIALCTLVALSACVLLPIPGEGNKPRYSHEQISKIQEGYSSRDEVVSVLGVAAIRRLDRYWVYHWKVDSGMWFAIGLPPLYGPGPPIVSEQFVLFLEFDEKRNLISKKFGDKIGNKYCTVNGLCLEHETHMAPTSRTEHQYDFHNMYSAFTISGSSKDSVPWPTLGGDRCVVVLWLNDRDWKDMEGLQLNIEKPVPQRFRTGWVHGVCSSECCFWLPVGSYVALSLLAGEESVRATELVVSEDFQCEANQTMYIEIGKRLISGGLYKGASIVLSTIDPEKGRQVIVDMSRLLPP